MLRNEQLQLIVAVSNTEAGRYLASVRSAIFTLYDTARCRGG